MKRARGASSSGAKRPAKIIQNITINNINTMHNHFATQAGPTTVPERAEPAPTPLFTGTDKMISWPDKNTHHVRNTYARVQSKDSGELIGECANCIKAKRQISDFAPAASIHTHRKRADFLQANEDYGTAYA